MDNPEELDRVDCFYQRRTLILSIIAMLSVLLLLVVIAMIAGDGFQHETRQYIWVSVASAILLGVIAAFSWMYWKRPVALRISAQGVDLPMVFRQPLAWSDIHRIRREHSSGTLQAKRDWLIIDPAPGVLAPLRLPVWRWLELKWQRYHGVRIPLHGIEGKADTIVASVERFRPVVQDMD